MEEADAISATARASVVKAMLRFAARVASWQLPTPAGMEVNAASIADVVLELVDSSRDMICL